LFGERGFFSEKNMNIESRPELSTFVSVTGSIDEQIQKATGLSGLSCLVEQMEKRSSIVRTDLLVPNKCNQNCAACFYKRECMPDINNVNEDVVRDIDTMLGILKNVDPSPYFYPREPTSYSSLPLLPKYKEVGMDSILTNAKTLTDQRVLDALKQAGIKSLTITMPGEANSYSIYTREPAEQYKLILDGISIAKREGFGVSTFMPVFEQNIYDVVPMVKRLYSLGVSTTRFIRVLPVGNAKEMPGDFFLKPESAVKFMEEVNRARLLYPDVKLSFFGQSFGPNFFSPGIWRALAGQTNDWPGTKFACPAINSRYLGIVLGSNEIVSCFEGMSLDNQRIGTVRDGKLIVDPNPSRSESTLRDNLRGLCSKDSCEYQPMCMGGCRTAAMSEAIQRGEPNPEFAGQTICLTQILKKEYGL
jgi:radical SAM protein with 4Fe4S-binding SPASM domain